MAPVIGMDCNPLTRLLESHRITTRAISTRCGLPRDVVYAALDPALAGELAARDLLMVRTAVEALLPVYVQPELRFCWNDIDRAISAGRNRSARA